MEWAPTVRFYVECSDGWQPTTATALLDALEDGHHTLDTAVVMGPGRPATPLRRLLRDLVWLSYQESQTTQPDLAPNLAPYRVAFADAPIGMVVADLGGRILHANQAFADLLSTTPAALEGVLIADVSFAEDRAQEVALGNELMAGKRKRFQVVKRFVTENGEHVPALVDVSLVHDDQGRPAMVVGSAVDHRLYRARTLLERREAEAIALQTLARAVAHDFGNVLFVLQSSLTLLDEDPGLTDHESLSAAQQAVDFATEAKRRLHSLATAGAGARQLVDISKAAGRHTAFLRQLTGPERTLHIDTRDQPNPVHLDPDSLQPLLLNLVTNARQATEPGGHITVRVHADDHEVCLAVSDDGCGMTPEVAAHVLEPYFTRRQGGTGLGLAIVDAIVRRAGGRIELDTAPGEGTTVLVVFPRATD